jgi:hypothetical protein
MSVLIEPDDTACRIREYVRNHPGLIYDKYKPERERSLQGGCYVLAESYYHSQGGTESGLDIYCLSWRDVGYPDSGTHWFLRRTESGTVVDLGLDRVEQAEHIPFGEATRRAFITGYEPSERCERVLDALGIAY